MYVSDHITGVESVRFACLNTRYLGDHNLGVVSEGRCHETSNGTGGEIGGAYDEISTPPSIFLFLVN